LNTWIGEWDWWKCCGRRFWSISTSEKKLYTHSLTVCMSFVKHFLKIVTKNKNSFNLTQHKNSWQKKMKKKLINWKSVYPPLYQQKTCRLKVEKTIFCVKKKRKHSKKIRKAHFCRLIHYTCLIAMVKKLAWYIVFVFNSWKKRKKKRTIKAENYISLKYHMHDDVDQVKWYTYVYIYK
jgi:hypothetical protein